MQETQVRSLSWNDPLEKEMATHSSILAWEIRWREGCRNQYLRNHNITLGELEDLGLLRWRAQRS